MTETVVWIDPDGVSTTLQAKWETTGRYMPPVEFEEDGVPGQPGMRFRDVRHGVREFTQTIWITGTTESDLRTQLRSIVDKMDPVRGQGTLRVTTPVGDQRQILCRYSGGLQLSETLGGDSGFLFQKAQLAFRAHSPYWEDITQTTVTYTADTTPPGTFLGTPFFPIHLAASEIVVDTTLTNSGSVDAWPVITINGTGDGIRLINFTVGKMIDLTSYILNGGSIVIDTRPGYKTVMNGVVNLWPYLSATSGLWPLRRGDNSIRIEMGDVNPVYTNVQISYTRQYLSP